VIAAEDAARAYRIRRGDRPNQWPVILVLPQDRLARERPLILATDAFVLTERIDDLLPRIIALSAHRLSVMPAKPAEGSIDIDPRFLRIQRLSARDRAILAELSRGSDNETIADRLAISRSMTKTSVRRVLGVLGVPNRTLAAVFAAAAGFGRAGR
jgi:DNA-binding NarL/FixJ family response regulator